jgi:negative regulator of replication initiation
MRRRRAIQFYRGVNVEDSDVLRRLLKVEAEAAALVKDAAVEADRRVAEAERQNRQRYDDAYSAEAAVLEEKYRAGIAEVKGEYQKRLDDFTRRLDVMQVNNEAFSQLLESLLFANDSREEKKRTSKKTAKAAGDAPLDNGTLFASSNKTGREK